MAESWKMQGQRSKRINTTQFWILITALTNKMKFAYGFLLTILILFILIRITLMSNGMGCLLRCQEFQAESNIWRSWRPVILWTPTLRSGVLIRTIKNKQNDAKIFSLYHVVKNIRETNCTELLLNTNKKLKLATTRQ